MSEMLEIQATERERDLRDDSGVGHNLDGVQKPGMQRVLSRRSEIERLKETGFRSATA